MAFSFPGSRVGPSALPAGNELRERIRLECRWRRLVEGGTRRALGSLKPSSRSLGEYLSLLPYDDFFIERRNSAHIQVHTLDLLNYL